MIKNIVVKAIIVLTISSIFLTACGKREEGKGNEDTKADQAGQVEEVDTLEESKEVEEDNNFDLNDDKGVVLQVEDIYIGDDKVLYQINNHSNKSYYYGADEKLEKYLNGSWVKVETTTEFAVIAIAYILGENDEQSYGMNLSFYDELEIGKYRILKEFTEDSTRGDIENLVVYGEFQVLERVDEGNASNEGRMMAMYLNIKEDVYSKKDKIVGFDLVNNGEVKEIVLEPTLYKEVGEEWVVMNNSIGYCGLPSNFEGTIDGEIGLEWYDTMEDGIYKVSFFVEEAEETIELWDLFEIKN